MTCHVENEISLEFYDAMECDLINSLNSLNIISIEIEFLNSYDFI